MNVNTVGLITNALSKDIALNQRTGIWEGRALTKVSRKVTRYTEQPQLSGMNSPFEDRKVDQVNFREK